MEKENKVQFKVYGKNALFTDPITRMGGEKMSYQIPTYGALRGIMEAIYWKPTIEYVIDRCRIMKSIQMLPKGVRPLIPDGHFNKSATNSLALYTYLWDVEYQVEGHFIWNEHRPDLEKDRNENKHYEILKRMIERGGRRDVYLGARECAAYVEPCVFGEGESAYDDVAALSFGLMFHSYIYPEQSGENNLKAAFHTPMMKNGVITFPSQQNCVIMKELRPMNIDKIFIPGENFTYLNEGDET